MLSIKLMSIESEEYFFSLAATDYYLDGGEPPGTWYGGAAIVLGLIGTVLRKVFSALFRGFCPTTGKALVQNAGVFDGDKKRQPGWDLTFSAPKSVSVIWSQASETVRQQIQGIHRRAVQAALDYAETTLAYSRVGKQGTGYVPVRLLAALFEHGTSRALDPQLHTHALVLNIGIGQDGQTRTILSKPLFIWKKILGAYYRAELANLLETELGLVAERKGQSFEIVGVPPELIRAYSKRRQEILEYLDKEGESGAIAASKAALATRRRKQDIPPRKELFSRWQQFNESEGFTAESIEHLISTPDRDRARDLPQALAKATENLSRQQSHFSFPDLLRETLFETPGLGLPPGVIPEAVKNHLASDGQIVKLRVVDGQMRYTTKAALEQERRLLDGLERLKKQRGLRVNHRILYNVFCRRDTISSEQALAVCDLTRGWGRVRVCTGFAGTGKTFMLQACQDAWEKQGYRVIAATPTGKAARVLEEATGIDTDTIHMRLVDFDVRAGFNVKHHLKQLGRAARGKRTYRPSKPKRVTITKKTVLVIDEAGMVNTRHLQMLIELVEKGGGMLVLLGDPAQLSAVDGGSPFHSVCERVSHADLRSIARQEEEWAREAVRLFAEGKPGEALTMFAHRGLLTVRNHRQEALRAMVLDWTAVGLTTPEHAVVLVPTNQESQEANRLCQQKRIEAGCLDKSVSVPIFDETDSDVTYADHVHIGDRVMFTRNSKKHGVENGSFGTVVAFGNINRSIAVRLDDGRTAAIPVKKFRHIRLGYCTTVYKSQGATINEVFVLAGGPMQDLPTSYVQASRAKHKTRIYTTKALMDEYLQFVEGSPLAKQMEKSPDLTLASDLLQDTADGSARHIVELQRRGMAQTDWTRRTEQSTASTQQSHEAQLAETAPELAAIFGDPAIVEQIRRQSEAATAEQGQTSTLSDGCSQHVLQTILQPQADIVLSHEVLPPLDQALSTDPMSTDVVQFPELAPLLNASADSQPVFDHSQPTAPQEFFETLHPAVETSLALPSWDTSTASTYTPSESTKFDLGQTDYVSSLAEQNQQLYHQQYAAAAQTWTTQQLTAPTAHRTIQDGSSQ